MTYTIKLFLMKLFFTAFITFVSFLGSSQDHISLNPEERAYLFHIVKKSPILDQTIGRYFDYQGPEIMFANKVLNYDSIETLIITNPDILVIRHDEIAKSTKGIIAEASNKMAIWELNKMLLAKRIKDVDFQKYEQNYARFEKLLMEKLPTTTLDETGSKPNIRMDNVLNPGLSLDDKVAQISSFRGMTHEDELQTILAINYAVNSYVQERSFDIYRALGGKAEVFQNVLTAAGDGSLTSGLLDEREKDEKGRWNKGLPKAIGFFPYEVKLTIPNKKKKEEAKVQSQNYTITDFRSVGKNKSTNLHFDVWGYNSAKQTTVVIEKNGKSYHLFGSGETRFLSPDSTFSSGTTFQSIINDLEFKKIGDLTEKIEGKNGFDKQIKYTEDKRDETELKIIKIEKSYSDKGYQPITTSSKPSRKAKKAKKIAVKAGSGADSFKAKPTTKANKKKKKSDENDIINLYERFQWYKAKIKELEIERQEAIDLKAVYQMRLDIYKRLMGYNWVSYTEKEGLYTFADSVTFDIFTQEFQFPASDKEEDFEVKLIAIPESALSDQADEVMLHVSLIDAKLNYNARVQIELADQFKSDSWELSTSLLAPKDSIAMLQFFESLLQKDQSFSIIGRGQGIGKWDGTQTVKDATPKQLDRYPVGQKMDSTFVRLRLSELIIHLDRGILLEVNSFTDPVKSTIELKNPKLIELKNQYKLSNNDILSAYRTVTVLNKFKAEMNYLAGLYLSREDAKTVIDKFNREFDKTKVSIGAVSLKVSDF